MLTCCPGLLSSEGWTGAGRPSRRCIKVAGTLVQLLGGSPRFLPMWISAYGSWLLFSFTPIILKLGNCSDFWDSVVLGCGSGSCTF